METSQKIMIGLLIFLVVGSIIGLIVYFVEKKKKDDEKKNNPPPPPAEQEQQQPSTTTYAESVPDTYLYCGGEGSVCSLDKLQPMYYGTDDKYVVKNLTGNVTCETSSFDGIDPSEGNSKYCYINSSPGITKASSVPSGYTACGTDGSQCKLNNPQLVYYGTGNKYIAKNLSGTITCLPASFNNLDPSFDKIKTCYVSSGQPVTS